MVKQGEIYKHYKNPNHTYEIIGIGKHSETLEDMVVYKALYAGTFPKGQIWVRPLSMFEETVGNGKPRFEKVL